MADFTALERWGYPEIAMAANTDFDAVEAPGLFDTLPPTVTMITALENLGRFQPIVFDIQDETLLSFHCVFVYYPNTFNLYEVAFDGDLTHIGARGAYAVSRVAVTGGWRYTVLRNGGWPSRPVVVARATDGGEV